MHDSSTGKTFLRKSLTTLHFLVTFRCVSEPFPAILAHTRKCTAHLSAARSGLLGDLLTRQ